MSIKQDIIGLVRDALSEQVKFLILRGVDDFSRDEGDIDILVPKGYSREALFRVTERALDSGWSVAAVRDIGYLTQVCLVNRFGSNGLYQAVKLDFFNGLSWGSLGDDEIGWALFDNLNVRVTELEAIGIVTFLQKMLYAGYLRARDWDRIAASCSSDLIMAYIRVSGLPLSCVDFRKGSLSALARWRLRAASAKVSLFGMPFWLAQVIFRKVKFMIIASSIPGRVCVIISKDHARREQIKKYYQSLLGSAGFPSAHSFSFGNISRLGLSWRIFRGDVVIVEGDRLHSDCSEIDRFVSIFDAKTVDLDATLEKDIGFFLVGLSQDIRNDLKSLVCK